MEEMKRKEAITGKLKEKVRELERMKLDEEQAVREKARVSNELKEELLEVKMHCIAMEEITRCNREDMIRTLGYVESFYGYPDMAKKEGSKEEEKR